jgi:hypothetical protein
VVIDFYNYQSAILGDYYIYYVLRLFSHLVATSRAFNGTVVLRRDGVEVQRWNTVIAPGQSFRATSDPAPDGGNWGVQVLDGGAVIAQVGP